MFYHKNFEDFQDHLRDQNNKDEQRLEQLRDLIRRWEGKVSDRDAPDGNFDLNRDMRLRGGIGAVRTEAAVVAALIAERTNYIDYTVIDPDAFRKDNHED